MNPKRPTPRHIIIKLLKVKESILKAALLKRKTTSYIQGYAQKTISDFSTETLQGRRAWHDTFDTMKEKRTTTKNTLPGKVIIQN